MSVEQRIPAGLAEPKRFALRPRLAWIIAAAEALAIVSLVAAIYALRSNDNPPPPAVGRANQALLGTGDPVKLVRGRVSTDPALGITASFEVFDHWFGEQRPGVLFLARHLTTGGYEVSVERGGIEVNTVDLPLARTARRLETVPGIRIHDVSPIRFGRHSGRRYSFYLNHYLTFGRWFGMNAGEHDINLLGVGHRTLVIRRYATVGMAHADQARNEAERVIQSFRFHS
jgi:hypothetical protein